MRFLLLLSAFLALQTSASAGVFFGNLHSHTSYSDGSATPEEAYAHARDVAGLDFLAITEHNHLEGANRIATDHELYSGNISRSLISTAARFNEEGVFVAIYGQEFSSIKSGNHANVFEVGEVIDTSDVPNGRWDALLNDWLPDHLDSQNNMALLLLNHPNTSGSPNDKEYGIDDFDTFDQWREKLDPHAQLINIVNGPSHGGDNPGPPSENEFLRYLNLGLHVAPTADQDNHRKNWGSAAETRTAVVAPELTKAALLSAMRSRHVYATEDRNLEIGFTVNGQPLGTVLSGNQVPSQGSTLSLELSITDADEPNALYTVDVFGDEVGGSAEADVIAQFDLEGNGTFSLDGITYSGGNEYFFLKITQTDDDGILRDSAWLAPVWFEPETTVTTGPSLTLDVNVHTEMATITNIGDAAVNLKDWKLISLQGNQEFEFPGDLILQPGSSVVVASGPDAADTPPEMLLWTNQHMWRNSGDPGELRDPDGTQRATDP